MSKQKTIYNLINVGRSETAIPSKFFLTAIEAFYSSIQFEMRIRGLVIIMGVFFWPRDVFLNKRRNQLFKTKLERIRFRSEFYEEKAEIVQNWEKKIHNNQRRNGGK